MTDEPPRPHYQGIRTAGRSASVRDAVISAAGRELSTYGYGAMSIGRIAAEAGVARTTIYRRWPTKEALVAAVIEETIRDAVLVPSEGTLEERLLVIAHGVNRAIATPAVRRLTESVVSLPAPEGEVVRQRLHEYRRAAYAALEHQLPEGIQAEGWELVEAVTAPLWSRALFAGQEITDDFVAEVVRRVVAALAAGAGFGGADSGTPAANTSPPV